MHVTSTEENESDSYIIIGHKEEKNSTVDLASKISPLPKDEPGICCRLFAGQNNYTNKDDAQETTCKHIEAETDHERVIFFEEDRHGLDPDAALWDEKDTVQPVSVLRIHPRATGKPIKIENPAFFDLRGASIAESTADA